MDIPIFLGIVANVTRHVSKLDNFQVVKKQLIEFIMNQVEVAGYFYSESNLDPYDKCLLASIIANSKKNYINLYNSFLQTMYITKNIDVDAEKFILVLTDNFENEELSNYLRCLIMAKKEECDLEILLIGVGNTFDLSLEDVVKGYEFASFYQVLPENLSEKLKEIICLKLSHKER